MKRSGRPTILSVAERAGVSRAAVSKVLRNDYGVSASLRARVEEAVQALNYRPLASARALRGSSKAVGILMAEITNPFFPEILDGVAQGLDPLDYQTFLGIGHFQQEQQERMVETMLDRQMDGLIAIAPSMTTMMLERFAADIPIVVVGHSRPEAQLFDSINSQDEVGAEMVVRHLHELGHRRIAMLGSEFLPEQEQVGSHRAKGYMATMRALGLANEIQVVGAPLYGTSPPPAVMDMLEGKRRPTAVFAQSDVYGVHVFNAADRLGIRIPDELAVVAYDDSWICSIAPLSLSSVQQSGLLLGTRAVELLIERIEGRTKAVHVQLAPTLVVRRSSGNTTTPPPRPGR